jgi:tetraacyldisaccharide 4'-kinase
VRFLLFPLSLFYWLITSFRNHLYNIGYQKSLEFDVNLICVGNLTVGGTGKTPMVEYLIRLLSASYKIATLSRGYGRKTSGFRLANLEESANTLGDEPFQFYKKFGDKIVVAVGEERALAIPQIIFHHEDRNLIILDDAFQHRRVLPNFNLLLSDYNRPFYNDYLLPAGMLRESRGGAKRANAVVVTKCPQNISIGEKNEIIVNIQKYSGKDTPVFFSGIKYMPPQSVFSTSGINFSENILLFSGIANPDLLEVYVKNTYNLIRHIKFADHYNYSQKDIERLKKEFDQIQSNNKCILTTEKDMVKLIHSSLRPLIEDLPVFYLPLQFYLLEGEEMLKGIILENLNS